MNTLQLLLAWTSKRTIFAEEATTSSFVLIFGDVGGILTDDWATDFVPRIVRDERECNASTIAFLPRIHCNTLEGILKGSFYRGGVFEPVLARRPR